MFYDLKISHYRYAIRLLGRTLLFSLFTLALVVNALGQTDKVSKGSETPTETDLVHHGDLIDVDVVGSLEYDWRGSLSPEGFLEGPEVITEPVYGLCKSESEIGSELTSAFGKFLRDPKVVVKVVDRSRRAEAIVGGAVRTPYRFQIRRPVRLNEMIILTG